MRTDANKGDARKAENALQEVKAIHHDAVVSSLQKEKGCF
jgi:hypothetical protein